jgi:PAS domain S-box-containing protein
MRPEDAFADKNLAERWRGIYHRAVSEGPFTTEYESPTAGNMVVTVNLLKRDGKVFGISVFARDITQRVRAERELRRLNRAHRALSATDQAMVRAQNESELLQETCRILVEEGGYRFAWVGLAEQDEAKTVRPVCHAGIEEGYLKTARVTWADTTRGRGPTGTAIRTERPVVCQNMLEDPRVGPWREEASRRGYASSCALPLVVGGKTIGALTVYSARPEAFDTAEAELLTQLGADLAFGLEALRTRLERQQSMEAQEKASAYNRSLLEASLDPLVTISPDGKITDVNKATEKVTGDLRQELIGTDFSDYFTQPEKARLGYKRVFKEGWVQDYELEVRHRDGSTTPVLYNASVYRDQRGEVAGVFAAARDISQRKRAEEVVRKLNEELEQRVQLRTAQLEVSNKELEAFTYSVSHDLRAPLRAMDGFSRILLEEYRHHLPAEAQKYLDFVRGGAVHMGKLIDGLLALSRLGRQDLKKRPVDVSEIVRQSMADLHTDCEGRAVEFILGALPACEADPLLLRQVFVNLLSNALKFSRKKEKVRIEVGALKASELTQPLLAGQPQAGVPVLPALPPRLDPNSWVYYVRDNGAGFDMRHADKLFGVFQRLHRQADFEGTGLGLATVQQIIHKHGGETWAEGEVDKGATFYFTIGSSTAESTDSHSAAAA